MKDKDQTIALFIDADNISVKYIDTIINELTKYGEITIRRIYGDWSKDILRSWLNVVGRYSLTPVMQERNTSGKNASDICLVIDAMDFLYAGKADCFCIVSSDGDFTKLAKRLRESSNSVIGMGEKKTPETFRNACERFVFLDVIRDTEDDAEDQTAEAKEGGRWSKKHKDAHEDKTSKDSRSIVDKDIIAQQVQQIVFENDTLGKKTGLGEIGSRLVKIYPEFDIRNYGYSKLSTFVNDLEYLSVKGKLKGSVELSLPDDVEIEQKILEIYRAEKTKVMNIGELKQILQKDIPNIDLIIQKSGVSKFSKYLERNIVNVKLSGQNDVKLIH